MSTEQLKCNLYLKILSCSKSRKTCLRESLEPAEKKEKNSPMIFYVVKKNSAQLSLLLPLFLFISSFTPFLLSNNNHQKTLAFTFCSYRVWVSFISERVKFQKEEPNFGCVNLLPPCLRDPIVVHTFVITKQREKTV